MPGMLLGLLILGTIRAAILFDGRLSSWWTHRGRRAVAAGYLVATLFLAQEVVFTRLKIFPARIDRLSIG